MDTADYETNAIVVNHVTSAHYALYEPASSTTVLGGPVALQLEAGLRDNGFLAYFDPVRRGIWCFRLGQKNATVEPPAFTRSIENFDFILGIAEEGAFELANLAKTRSSSNAPASASASATSSSLTAHSGAGDQDSSRNLAISDGKAHPSTSLKDLYEHLVSAILSALTTGFCVRTGALPLNSRTLLLSRDSNVANMSCLDPILGSLRVYLTTTGVLIATISLSFVRGLRTVANSPHSSPPLGTTVLAAPLGLFATGAMAADGDAAADVSSTSRTPDHQAVRVRHSKEKDSRLNRLFAESHYQTWQSYCLQLLRSRSVSFPLTDAQKWLGLDRLRRKPLDADPDGRQTPWQPIAPSSVLVWPADLCFCKAALSNLSLSGTSSLGGDADNDKKGLSDANPKPYDPLVHAQFWALAAQERDATLMKRKRERQAATSTAEVNMSDNGLLPPSSGLSPFAVHRNANAQPALPPGAMYPTPPDGVHIPVGATPSMDGTASSPGNQTSIAAVVDIDTIMATGPTESFNNGGWETIVSTRKDPRTSSFESENLFGDLGTDMFGDNNITDADFSFFDQQPADMGLGLDLNDVPNSTAHDLGQHVTTLAGENNAVAQGQMQIQGHGQVRGQGQRQHRSEETHLPPPPPPHVFAKPARRGARSNTTDLSLRHANNTDSTLTRGAGIKRHASPFNPDTVFKRVRASLHTNNNHNNHAFQRNARVPSAYLGTIMFERVDFNPTLFQVQSKYRTDGPFHVPTDRIHVETAPVTSTLPTTDYLKRHGKGRRKKQRPPNNYLEVQGKMAGAPGCIPQQPSPVEADNALSDADDSSLVSDMDDSSSENGSVGPLSPSKSVGPRRGRLDDDLESIALSTREAEDSQASPIALDLPRSIKAEIELPLAKYFADPEPASLSRSIISDQEFILTAQILTDQASTSTLPITMDRNDKVATSLGRRRDLLNMTRQSLRELRATLPDSLGILEEWQLRPFIEVQDVPLLGQPRIQPRLAGAEQTKPSNLFQIPSPHLEMRRNDLRLSVLPSATQFWESLGLGPPHGTKDVKAVCIYPELGGVGDSAAVFLDRMQSAYESLKLGSFARLPSDEIPGGLLPYHIENPQDGSPPSLRGPSLSEGIVKISDSLLTLAVKETNFVMFVVYPRDVSIALMESCFMFHQLFERCRKLLANKRKPVENDIVLQLVPLDFIASPDSLVVPFPSAYTKLASEVYDRCTLFSGPMPAPSIILEKLPPRMIDFRVTTMPSASLLQENTCLHVAYAQSIDDRWVTAAWTDNSGRQQSTASYCLARRDRPAGSATPMAAIAAEIWETTRDLIRHSKVHWRVMLAKCGVMGQAEIETWANLAQLNQDDAGGCNVSLTLITVDSDPSLQLLPPAWKAPSSIGPHNPTHPNSTHPAPNSAPDTPPTDPDPAETTLVDLTDQTHGAILAHRLSNTHSPVVLAPAIASGYLIKRTGPRPEDPPALLEVNIVFCEGNHPRAHEVLLREVLGYYRNLGTLARARGMLGGEDARPWHVGAAERGVRGVWGGM